jgi:hypothetical protein
MKRLILVVVLVVSSACAVPASFGGRSTAQLTAPGVQALHTVEAVKALDLVRDTAIDGEAAKVIPTDTTALVVKAHKSILIVIRTTPGGWKPAVIATLEQLKKDIPARDATQLGPYIDAAISIIKAVIQ